MNPKSVYWRTSNRCGRTPTKLTGLRYNHPVKKIIWLLAPLLLAGLRTADAASVPTAGTLQPPTTKEPQAIVATPLLSVQKGLLPDKPALTESDATRMVVHNLQFEGSVAFAPAVLVDACGFVSGRSYSLAQLRETVGRIERYFQSHGYPVAQAYLADQKIQNGTVTVTVSEGRYDQILVRNQSQVSPALLADLLQDTKSGSVVHAAGLESQLLLLTDLPGIRVQSALVPGKSFGQSDLLVEVLPTRRIVGSMDADNAGNYYTGALRLGANLSLNEPTGEGDVLSLRLLTSGEGLNYFRSAYSIQLGHARIGAGYSNMAYGLGQEFDSLRASGSASAMGVFGTYPFIRSRQHTMSVGVGYESKRFEDRLDSVASITEKSSRVYSASLSGEHRDAAIAGGLSNYSLALTSGTLTILTAAAYDFDASTAQSQGHFNKLAYSANHLQNLGAAFSIYAAVAGQLASKNLDVSEKMAQGGMFAVRAYPEGEAYGDEGYVLNLEARWVLPNAWQTATGQLQGLVFFDTGNTTVDKNPWSPESTQRRLSGAGFGVSWLSPDSLHWRLLYAHTVGDEPVRSKPTANARLWLQGVKYF